jgi:hypothetical protein
MISRPAIEPAISTLPVRSQLTANVSSVPRARQLSALRRVYHVAGGLHPQHVGNRNTRPLVAYNLANETQQSH